MDHRNQDLTSGNVPGKLLRFALPLFGANLLQSLYSIADMVVVGRFVGKTGLAAISNASMIGFIINSICIGLTMGGTVLAAQYKGAGDGQGQDVYKRQVQQGIAQGVVFLSHPITFLFDK